MPDDSIQDSTRYVVSDVHHGSVLPGERLEMERDVYLLPGADIRGSVWSGELSISGPGIEVANSVYSQGAVVIDTSDDVEEVSMDDDVTIGGSLTTPDSLLVETTDFRSRFLADLYVERANLSNAFVFGNVYARGAVIRDSIVLGGIFCDGALELSNSFVHTFQSHRAEVGENVSMFAPFALARDTISLSSPVRALTFADVFREGDHAEEGGLRSGDVVHLDEDDVFRVKGITPEASSGDGAPQSQAVLSMTERILDSSLVQERLQQNKKFLRSLSLNRHVADTKQGSSPVDELEETLWKLVANQISEDQEARSSRSLQDLLEQFDLV